MTYNANALPALAVPTTANAAATQFFREKASGGAFGRGQRMPDLRRMLRQYGTPYGFANDDAVFPSGISNLNAAAFEHAVNFAISDAERTNPNVVAGADGTMCVDRKPLSRVEGRGSENARPSTLNPQRFFPSNE